MDFLDAIKIAQNKLGINFFNNLKINYIFEEKSNTLTIKRETNKVDIFYSEKCMIFRALTYLKENFDNLNFNISFKRNFRKNGYMVDCSRNGVVNLSQIKEIILFQALIGQNRLLLYTEDTYKLEKYPFFGYLRGGYSKEEIKEIVEYGKAFGIELIPCIQTLGHLYRPLHWEPMIPLRDGASTLLVDDEKVYEFIEEMIKFSREAFETKEIHIGMDESTEIGLGRYLQFHQYADRINLFSRHLERIIKICKKYNFIPMIWSDMYFRLNNDNEEYYRNTPLPDSTINLIPKGIELVYWDYYHDDQKIYDQMFSYHKHTKCPTIFAGGAWRWKGFAPSIRGSFNISIPALKSCLKNKTDFVFVTAWGDNGNECSIIPTFSVLALYSVADYTGTTNEDLVDSLLKAIFGETLDDFELLDLPDRPNKKVLSPQYNPSKFFLYQDVMNGIFDQQVKPNFAKNYLDYSKLLESKAKMNGEFSYIYHTLSLLCKALSIKVDMGVRLRKAYKENNKAELLKISQHEIPTLIKVLVRLNEAHRIQWNKENKPFGFDVVDGRMGYLINRLKSTSIEINNYLSNKIEKLVELETEILPYNGHEDEICWNWWETTVTVHNI